MSQLKQNLTLFDMSMIAIGSVIGSGIFFTPSLIANSLPSPMWILFVWVLGGVIALTGALTYAGVGISVVGGAGLLSLEKKS